MTFVSPAVGGSTPKGGGGRRDGGRRPPPALRATSPNVASLLGEETLGTQLVAVRSAGSTSDPSSRISAG